MHSSRYFTNRYKDYDGNLGSCDYVRNLIPEILQKISKNCPPNSRSNRDGGLYVGPAGVAYAFYHVATSGLFDEQREKLLNTAWEYIQVSVQDSERTNPRSQGGIGASFLLGHVGVYTVAALISHALGHTKERDASIAKVLQYHEICKPLDFFKPGSDELFVGRAGYLCASLKLNQAFCSQVIPDAITAPLFDATIQSGRYYAQRHRSASSLMYAYYDKEYLGAGHGLSSILQMLLSFPQFLTSRPEVESTLREAVEFVLRCERNGDYPPVPGESHMLVHWCHGAPGVVYLFAKAFLVWKDQRYLQAALRCGEVVWERGLLRKGPGICHGVAGNGYVFLLLYRLTRDPKYLYRSYQFSDFMQTAEFTQGARTPDCPYSLFEGLAGTICFYADLMRPDKASFPFFDVCA